MFWVKPHIIRSLRLSPQLISWILPVACTINFVETMAAQKIAFRNPDEGTKLVGANTKFALSLYKEILKAQPAQNVFFSPASISVALAMTYLGARENTAEEMKNVLNFGDVSEAMLHECFSDLHDSFHNTGGNYILHIANKLFGDKSFSFVQEFLEHTNKHYKAELTAVDFQGNSEAARSQINQWVEEKTAQKIKDILPAGSVDAMTVLILVNAIYFKGDWNSKFDSSKTQTADFNISSTEKVQVEMMYKKEKWNYGFNQDLDAKCLELPYANKSLSMFVLLPSDSSTEKLQQLESGLTADHMINAEKAFRMHEMDVHTWLPRFKLTDSFELSDTLGKMGIQDLFDMNKANLKGIDAMNRLFVQKVLHKAFIEVNEEGSEAAAATAVKMMMRSMPREFHFKADHPFLFFIRENTTKSVLFFGKLVKPESASGKDEL